MRGNKCCIYFFIYLYIYMYRERETAYFFACNQINTIKNESIQSIFDYDLFSLTESDS